MVKVNGAMLAWAREENGIPLSRAASLLGIKSTQKISAEEKLISIEKSGELSKSLFDKVLSVYRKPMLTYFLESPPTPTNAGQDFRSPSRNFDPSQNAIVKAILTNVTARQNMVKEILVAEDEAVKLSFINSFSLDLKPSVAAEMIRESFGIDLIAYRKGSDYQASFRYLRNKIEEKGVFVLLKGNLGNYRSDVEIGTFRGFAISDDVAPFIVINHQESKSSRAQTLLHELVHILLGCSGVSANVEDDVIEKFCDSVASSTLVYEHEISSFKPRLDHFSLLTSDISAFALSKKISSTHVAYRLLEEGYIDNETYKELAAHFHRLWLQQKQSAKDNDSSPSGLVIKRSYLGKLVEFAERMYMAGAISPTQAAIVLDTPATKVKKMFVTE